MEQIKDIVTNLKNYFRSGQTASYDFRVDALRRLKKAIASNEDAIFEALKKDLNKTAFESYTSEILLIIEEIDYSLKYLKK